jgi:hypothetical protein
MAERIGEIALQVGPETEKMIRHKPSFTLVVY